MSKIPSKNIEICYDFLGQIYNLLSRCSHTPFCRFYFCLDTFLLLLGNKNITFVYQKFSFCLFIAKAMAYHQTLGLDIIAAGVYHQPQAVSSFALMIYPNKLRMIYTA